MKNQFRDRLSFCATMIEMVVGALILIGCIISGIALSARPVSPTCSGTRTICRTA